MWPILMADIQSYLDQRDSYLINKHLVRFEGKLVSIWYAKGRIYQTIPLIK